MADSNQVDLKKQLGLTNCVSFLIALIIGSGIFISPKVTLFIIEQR